MSVAQGTGTYPAYIGNSRLLSTAGGGTALSTTKVWIPIPPGISNVLITPRNFATAVVAKVSLNPFITVLKTIDGMSTPPTNYSEAAQDGAAGTLVTLSSLPTLANGGAVYVGAVDLFGGLMADVVDPNGGGGTMAVTYWNGTAWTNITPTDGTTNLSADGLISWTVPTDWVQAELGTVLGRSFPGTGQSLYWVRIATSVAYDASTTLASLYAYSRFGDSVMELASGQVFGTAINRAQNGGVIQAQVDAVTGNLIVNGFY